MVIISGELNSDHILHSTQSSNIAKVFQGCQVPDSWHAEIVNANQDNLKLAPLLSSSIGSKDGIREDLTWEWSMKELSLAMYRFHAIFHAYFSATYANLKQGAHGPFIA